MRLPARLLWLSAVLAAGAWGCRDAPIAELDGAERERAWETLDLGSSERIFDDALEGLDEVVLDPPPRVGEDYAPAFPPDLPFDPAEWTTAPAAPSVADPAAIRGGTLRLAMGEFPPTLRTEGPNSRLSTLATLHDLVYETLLGLDIEGGNFTPGLASHWRIGDDRRSFRFRIDERARWSDGRAVTADDVAATFEHLRDPDRKDPAVAQSYEELIESVTVLDRLTVEIVAREERWRAALTIAAGTQIYPAAYIRMDGETYLTEWDWKLPPGSGPYAVEEVERGRSLTMRRRTDWWGDTLPRHRGTYNFAHIRWDVVRDRELEYQRLLKDELDLYIVGRAQRWVDEVDREAAVRKGWIQKRRVWNQNPQGYAGYAFNLKAKPFDDLRVRAAFAHLFDREKLFEKFLLYQYEYMASYFPGQMGSRPDAEPVRFDPDRARRLLAEAGWTGRDADGYLVNAAGERFPTVVFDTQPSDAQRLHEVFKADLRNEAGIELEMRFVDGTTLLRNVWERKFQIVYFGWTAGLFPNPEFQFHSKYADQPQTNNINGYANPEADRILEAYQYEFDQRRRVEMLQRLDGILFHDHLYALSWYAPYFRILYWDRFGHPEEYAGRFADGVESVLAYWWFDPQREERMLEAKAAGRSAHPDAPLGQADPVEQTYWRDHELPISARDGGAAP